MQRCLLQRLVLSAAAVAAPRSQRVGAYLRRQRSRLGAPKAITAAAHKLARIVYALVRYGGEYVKRTEAEYTERVRGRLERQLKRRARELGYEVTMTADPPASDRPVCVPPEPPASE